MTESLTSASSIAATLSWVGVVAVCLSLFIFYVQGRRSIALTLQSAIPFLLVPLCLQSISSAATIVEAFRFIATQKATGALTMYAYLIGVEQSLVSRLEEIACAVVVIALFPLARLIKKSGPGSGAQPSPAHSGTPLSPSLTAAVILLAIGAFGGLIWSVRDVPHILQTFINPALHSEFEQRFGQAGFYGVVTYINRHLLYQVFVSVNLAFLFLFLGIKLAKGNDPQRRSTWVAGLLALVFVAACGGAVATGRSSILTMQAQVAKIEHQRASDMEQ